MYLARSILTQIQKRCGESFLNRLNKGHIQRQKKNRTKDRLSLDLVLAAEHVVHLSQVVSTRLESLGATGGLEVLLQVGVLAQLAHLVVGSGGQDVAGLKTVLEVKLLNHVGDVANNLGAEHGGGETTAVAEKTDALGLVGGEADVADQTGQTGVDRGSVHVTAESSNLKTGLDAVGETLLGQTHEGLLDGLVGQRSGVVEVTELRGDLSEGRVGGVGEVVVVEHASEGLLDQLAGRGVEEDVVEAVQRGLSLLGGTVGTVLVGLQDLLAGIEALVAGVNGLSVAAQGEVAVNNGVLAGEVGLVEVVGVGEVRGTETGLENNGGIGTDEHSNTTSTTGGAGSTSGVQSNITTDDDGVTAIPGGRLEPVDAVEDSVGTTVAGVDGVDTLNVGVAVGSKQLHQNGLDGLGLVQESLSADLETTDRLGVDVVLVHEGREGGQGHGVDVYYEVEC